MLQNVSKLDEYQKKLHELVKHDKDLTKQYLHDYNYMSPTASLFMSLPFPAWIKSFTKDQKEFKVNLSNFAYYEAFGVRPEEGFLENNHWSDEEVKSFHINDIKAWENKSYIVSEETIYNNLTKQKEKLKLIKFFITENRKIYVGGLIFWPPYFTQMFNRGQTKSNVEKCQYNNLSMCEDEKARNCDIYKNDQRIFKKLQEALISIDILEHNLSVLSDYIVEFCNKLPIPLCLYEYEKTRYWKNSKFYLTVKSPSFIEPADKQFLINTVKTQKLLNDGKPFKKDNSIKKITWPIVMNNDITYVGGIDIFECENL